MNTLLQGQIRQLENSRDKIPVYVGCQSMVGRNGDIIRIYTETGKLGKIREQWFRGKLGKIFRSREKLTGVRNRNYVFVKEEGIYTFQSLWEV
jgi:hypothetical protein